nr:uncharacterized protein CTRU02_03774 [Colletotrichum truncatum]KAF6796796.1 hypothetical protein CTRU02_03774 [Colletotrichum truncatum]
MVNTRGKQNVENSWNRHMRGTESLWYYGTEKFRAIAFDAQRYFDVSPSDQRGTPIFVSVETVLGLGFSLIGNESKDDYHNEGNGNENKVSEWTDEELIEGTPTDWKMSENNKTTGVVINIRLKNGTSSTCRIKVHVYPKAPDSWTAYVRKVLSLGGGKTFKPTRQCDMPLKWPLLVKPLEKRQNLIQSRFGLTVNEFFRHLIAEANTANAESKKTAGMQNTTYGQWTLQLYDDSSTQNYKMMSVDPFQLYSTWIHEDDWHSYMTMLSETEKNPIRKFISLKNINACNTLNDLMLKVGERDLKIQGDLSPKEREACGLKPEQEAYDKAALNGFNRRKISEALKQKRLQGINSQIKRYNFYNGQTTIEVVLEASKMESASGKRPSQLTQAVVMGGVSASDIATGLDWEKGRLASGFYSSEWLHLSAFSWGGFLPAGAKSGFSTSQNLENLIFGTSETNSLMTR